MASFPRDIAFEANPTLLGCCILAVQALNADLAFYVHRLGDDTGKVLAAYPREDFQPEISFSIQQLLTPNKSHNGRKAEFTHIVVVPSQCPYIVDLSSALHKAGFDDSIMRVFPVAHHGQIEGGFFIIGHADHAELSRSEYAFCQLITSQISLLMEKQEIVRDAEDKDHQLHVLGESIMAITSKQYPDELIALLTEKAAELLRAKSAGLYQYSFEKQCLTLIADTLGRYKGTILSAGEGMAGKLVNEGLPFLIIPDYRNWSGRASAYEEDHAYGAVLGVPLRRKGKCVGVLYVADRKDRGFTSSDAVLLGQLADQAALAIEQHMESRRSDFLLASTKLLAEARPFEQGLEKLSMMVCDLLQSCYCRILLAAESTMVMVVKAASAPPNITWTPGKGEQLQLERWPDLETITRTGTPIVYRSPLENAKLREFVHDLSLSSELKSLILSPLTFEDQLLGFLEVGELSGSDHWIFEERPEELLAATGRQVSVVIAKQFAYAQAERGRRRFQALYNATRPLIWKKADIALKEMVDSLPVYTSADGVVAIIVRPDGDVEKLYLGGERIDGIQARMRPDGISSQVLKTGEPRTFEDTAKYRNLLNPVLFENDCRAAACLPIMLQGKPIGVLWLSYRKKRRFTSDEVDTFALLAGHIAVSYDNSRRIKRTELMQAAVAEISIQSTSPEVRRKIVENARSIFKADFVTLWPFDTELRNYRPEEVEGIGQTKDFADIIRLIRPSPGHTTDKILQEDWIAEGNLKGCLPSYMKEETRQALLKLGIRSYQGALLKSGKQAMGVLYLGYRGPRDFHAEDAALLKGFADYSALALKQASLFHELHEIADSAQTIAHQASQGNLPETLRAVVAKIMTLLNCHSVVLYTFDPDSEEIGYPPTSKGIADPKADWPDSHLPEGSLVRRMIQLESPYVARSVADDPLLRGARFPKRHGIVSCAIVPLIVAKKTVGVLFVNHSYSHQFVPEEQLRIQFFADQAAVAIQHAQLLQKRERQLREKNALVAVAHELLKKSSLDETLQQVAQLTMGELHTSRCFIVLSDDTKDDPSGALILGESGWDPFWVGTKILGPNSHAGWVIRNNKPAQFCKDELPQFDVSLEQENGLGSGLGVPIVLKGETLGAILVQDEQKRVFTPDEITVLELIADQIASAIQNALQYQDLVKRTAHSKAFAESAKSLAEVKTGLDSNEIFKRILQEALKSVAPHQRRGFVVGTIQRYDHDKDEAELRNVETLPSDLTFHPSKGTVRNLKKEAEAGRKIGVTGRVILTGEPIIVRNTSKNTDFLPCCPYSLSEIAVPILEGNIVLGAISLESDLLWAFNRADQENLEALAKLAVVNIQQSRDAEKLDEAYEELKAANKRKDWFIRVLSHELRAPLEPVRIFIESVLQGDFGKCILPMRQSAERALDSIREESGLIENLLDLVKLYDDRVPFRPGMKNMKILLESVHQTFLHRASGKDIKFEIDLPEQEDLTAYIDEAMIKQVFNNLVSNALKFTERGGTVSLTAARSASNIVIRVKDTGRGIPLGAREHLFQPLFQVKGDDIKAGLGFGLTIVKQYVDRHRGEIKVESEQGQGSEFIVTLPKTWAPAKPAES